MSSWRETRPQGRRRLLLCARLAGGGLLLAVLVRRLGVGPFESGLRRVDAPSLTAALGITAMTTIVSAWRWRLIGRGLGLRIPMGDAISAYYRSQFLNSTLPGGVLGDLHRGLRLGQQSDDVSRGLRSVVWDRAAGQVAQVVLATVALLALASPVRAAMAAVVGVMVGASAVIVLMVLTVSRRGQSWPARAVRAIRNDVRAGLLTPRAGPAIFIASALVVMGHVAVFLVAATVDGAPSSIRQLFPLSMLVLLSMSLPTNIGGWGPREGVAAWSFALAGLGAARGVEIATTYGVLSLVATLPGAVVLVLSRRTRPSRSAAARADVPRGELVRSGTL